MVERGDQTLILGRFRVESLISRGGFGVVLKAYDTRLTRMVAIKQLSVSDSSDPETAKMLSHRFAREAQAFGRVRSHPNIVMVYDFVHDDESGIDYLILEYVAGDTLARKIGMGPIPLDEALRLCQDYARGLHAAHEADIVHRDVKPANLFIAADGRGQVGDFGVAQIDDGLSRRTYLTREHPGTPRYMSPEQEQTSAYLRPLSDQYSLGLVFFEMLTGMAYKRVGPREAERRLTEMSPPVAALVRQMTMINPDDRFATMDDVARAIEAILRGQSVPFATAGMAAGAAAAAPPALPPPPPPPAPGGAQFDGPPPPPGSPALAAWVAAREAALPAPQRTRRWDPRNQSWQRLSLIAVAVAVLVIIAGGTIAASGAGGLGRAPVATATVAALVVPTLTPTALPPTGTPVPTATATLVPTLTSTAVPPTPTLVPPTPTMTMTMTATATPKPPPPTELPPVVVYGLGTLKQGNLESVVADDVVEDFNAGDEIFVFVNFDGARPGVDSVELVVFLNDAPRMTVPVVLAKAGGFVSVSLGALEAGVYRLEVWREGGPIFESKPIRVAAVAPPPTAPPVTPVTPGTTNPTPTPRPVTNPTPTPVPAQPTPTPRPATNPTPTPVPAAPTPTPRPATSPTKTPCPPGSC
jgi:hypothetical protein